MNLVLQCAMCGTHHPVGTRVCSTCRATGVTQLRLMFECPTCGHLGLDPACDACPAPTQSGTRAPDEDLIVAEEVFDEPLSLDDDDYDVDLAFDEDEEDEKVIVDLSDDLELADDSELEGDEPDSDVDNELEYLDDDNSDDD